MTDLDAEEQEILEAYQSGQLRPVALSRAEVESYRAAAPPGNPHPYPLPPLHALPSGEGAAALLCQLRRARTPCLGF